MQVQPSCSTPTVKSILTAVVNAVDVPVTLKIRTGWEPEHRNCVEIAQLAEECGIQALTIHGRTRACLFNGDAEYDSIRAVKQKVSIPIIANGDITDPLKARAVLDYTGADALMIGRAAQEDPDLSGNPALSGHWRAAAPLPLAEVKRLLCAHVRELHDFYGQAKGYRIARKHVSGIFRNMLQMTSFGAHSTPLRMPANSWRRWRHTSKILRNRNKELTELCSNNA